MRSLIFVVLVLLATTASAQYSIADTTFSTKHICSSVPGTTRSINKGFDPCCEWKTMSLLFLGGMADGFGDVLQFHYPEFKQVFPNANDQFWDPQQSWRNKYRDRDPANGRAFFGSRGVFVPLTDGWHAAKFTRTGSIILAVAVSPSSRFDRTMYGHKKGLWWRTLIVRSLAYSACYAGGQYLMYDVVFSDKK